MAGRPRRRLVNRPEVVFFDELTTGLGPQARRATWELVRRVRDDGATVVLVTHFVEEAEQLCDRGRDRIAGRPPARGRVVPDAEPATWAAPQGATVTGRRCAEGADSPLLGREIERWWGDDGGDLLLTRPRPGRRRCSGPGDGDPSQLV